MGIFWNAYLRYYDVGDDGWAATKPTNDVSASTGIAGSGLFSHQVIIVWIYFHFWLWCFAVKLRSGYCMLDWDAFIGFTSVQCLPVLDWFYCIAVIPDCLCPRAAATVNALPPRERWASKTGQLKERAIASRFFRHVGMVFIILLLPSVILMAKGVTGSGFYLSLQRFCVGFQLYFKEIVAVGGDATVLSTANSSRVYVWFSKSWRAQRDPTPPWIW